MRVDATAAQYDALTAHDGACGMLSVQRAIYNALTSYL